MCIRSDDRVNVRSPYVHIYMHTLSFKDYSPLHLLPLSIIFYTYKLIYFNYLSPQKTSLSLSKWPKITFFLTIYSVFNTCICYIISTSHIYVYEASLKMCVHSDCVSLNMCIHLFMHIYNGVIGGRRLRQHPLPFLLHIF